MAETEGTYIDVENDYFKSKQLRQEVREILAELKCPECLKKETKIKI